MADCGDSDKRESGLIAQEVYYNCPELRHLVSVGEDIDEDENATIPTPVEIDLSNNDITDDINYDELGWGQSDCAGLNYIGLIPYLIKSIQELHQRIEVLENNTQV